MIDQKSEVDNRRSSGCLLLSNAMMRVACTAIGVGVLMATWGCTSLLSESDTADSVNTQLSKWACLGRSAPSATKDVTYTVDVVDWVLDTPPAGMQIIVCSSIDVPLDPNDVAVPCKSPISQVVPPVQRSVDVLLHPRDEGVFIAFMTQAFAPEALWFNRPLATDVIGKPSIRLISLQTAANIAMGFGRNLDQKLGLAVLRIVDCNGDPAAGVTATLMGNTPSPNMIPFTIGINGADPVHLVTDEKGQFGFANVAPGNVTAHAFLTNGTTSTDDDTDLGTVSFTVRPFWATAVDLRP